MENKNIDITLDMSDKDFANFITPQFERTDGRSVCTSIVTEAQYKALPFLSQGSLKSLGCQMWDEEDGEILWLYPKEWYELIPEGFMVTTINGEEKPFVKGETDDDIRFGALAFGFTQKT